MIPHRLIGFMAIGLICIGSVTAQAVPPPKADVHAAGKKLAFDRRKGNCLACHQIIGGDSAGNIGPPLITMKTRYPDKAILRKRIWDATAFNPETPMPPFGRHKILTEKEVDLVTSFIWSL